MSDTTAIDIKPAPVALQIWLLTKRLLLNTLRNPSITMPNIVITVFFLYAYDGLLGGSASITALTGGNYGNFILPVVVLFSSISASNSGLALVYDMESGYFYRQLAMPLSRAAIVIAPILIGAIQVSLQAVLVILLGFTIGIDPAAGFGGLLMVILFALIWGMAFAGYSVATGLMTGNAQATQAAGLIFFPVMFLTPALLPASQLKAWIGVIADINPTTYVLEGMRTVLIDGWEWGKICLGLGVGIAFAIIMMAWAVVIARRVTARG